MPKPKGEKIENNKPKKKTVRKKSLTQKLSDTEIEKFLDLESKKQNEVNQAMNRINDILLP